MKFAIFAIALILSGCNAGITERSSLQTTTTASAKFAADPSEPEGPPVVFEYHPSPIAPDAMAVFIGDSITAAWSFPVAGYVNAGVSGQRSTQMLARFQTDVLSHHPTIVVILAGTNDVRQVIDPSTDAVAEMAAEASSAGACVIIGTVPPDDRWGAAPNQLSQSDGDAAIARWNQALVALTKAYGYRLADYHEVLVNPDGTQNQALFVDQIHPNADGYKVMWPVVHQMIHDCDQRL